MLKKEGIIILVVFLLFASLFFFFGYKNINNITGLAVSNVSDPSFSVELSKSEISSGDSLTGFLNITFPGPFDPSTTVNIDFNGASNKLVLKDYFKNKNISFAETSSIYSVSNPSDSKSFNFASAGSNIFAFKLPKTSNVKSFVMNVGSSPESPVSFVSFDVDDYTNKKEWKYFGNFIDFNTDYIYPASLDINLEGDPVTLGGQADSNKTYFCEVIDLPESKHFKMATKLKKNFEGANVKAVILSFDGEYASGGADFCDLPEPPVGLDSNWYTCDLSFDTAKQGAYLACVYYEGDNSKQYYELSRSSAVSNSRFDCPITGGNSLCFKSFSKDYFIGVKTAKYTGVLDKSVSWVDGVTDQSINFSLTQFLQDCESDDVGDCAVPVTVSSESAGTLQISGLRIDYTEAGGASSYSDKFYDIVQIPGRIVNLGGVDLENSSKTIQISLSEFNITAPNITKTFDSLPLEVKLTPGSKVSKTVKVYSEGYVPETGDVEDSITNAKSLITTMKNEHSEEISLFDINTDSSQLELFEAEINNIKSDTNVSVDEVNSRLATLSEQVDAYLQNQPKEFFVSSSFKDLYIAEPGDVEKVVLENVDDVYFYQSSFEVSVEVSNYVLERHDGSKEKYSVIKKIVTPYKAESSVYVYEIIPKIVVNNIADVFFKDKNYEVVQQDPIIRYTFDSFSQPKALIYGVKNVDITPSMISSLGSVIVPKKVEEIVKENYECGDGICTEPYEDKTVCPEDCGGRKPIPWLLIVILVVLLIAGVVYINFYKGKGAFRKVIGMSPFSHTKDLENVKSYIKAAKEKGIKNQDIASALLKSGWNKNQVVYAFEDLNWDEKRLFTIRFAPGGKENVKKLQTFIKKCLELNIPIEQIKKVLVEKGWSVDNVNEALIFVGKPKEKVETEKEKKKKISYYFEKGLEEEAKKQSL